MGKKQTVTAVILFVSLPFYNKNNFNYEENEQQYCRIGLLADDKQKRG